MKFLMQTILLVGLLFTLESCSKDPCKGVNCVNGECVDGTCECTEGYGGETCEIKFQDLYLGVWSGLDCQESESTLTINPSEDVTLLFMSYNGLDLTAKITSKSTILVEEKEVVDPIFGQIIKVSGNGTLKENGKLDFDLLVVTDAASANCLVEFTKA